MALPDKMLATFFFSPLRFTGVKRNQGNQPKGENDEIVTAIKTETPSQSVSDNDLHSQFNLKPVKKELSPKNKKTTLSGEKRFSCKVCDKKFNRKQPMLEHERIHSGKKPFKCIYCNKTFTQSGSAKRHERSHTRDKPFTHTANNQQKISNNHEEMHKTETKNCNENIKIELNNKEINETFEAFQNPGKICEDDLLTPHSNKIIISDKNLVMRKVPQNKRVRNFQCERCQKKFHQKNHLVNHMKKKCSNNEDDFDIKNLDMDREAYDYPKSLTRKEDFGKEKVTDDSIKNNEIDAENVANDSAKMNDSCDKDFLNDSSTILTFDFEDDFEPHNVVDGTGKINDFEANKNTDDTGNINEFEANKVFDEAGKINHLDTKDVPNDSARINDLVAKKDAMDPPKLTIISTQNQKVRNFQCELCQKKFHRKPHLVYHMNKKKKCSKNQAFQNAGKICEVDKLQTTHPNKSITSDKKQEINETFEDILRDVSDRKKIEADELQNLRSDVNIEGEENDEIVTAIKSDAPSNIVDDNALHSLPSHKPMKKEMNSMKKFSCNYCDKNFITKQVAHVHERVHTGEKPYQCRYCNKKFSTSGNTKQHEKTHTGEKNFNKADKNQIKFYVKQEIINEDETKNKNMKINQAKKESNQIIEGGHSEEIVTAIKSEAPPSEIVSNNEVHSQISQKTINEEMNCRKKFSCNYCDKKFVTKQAAHIHERVHTGEKPYQCRYCNKKFSTSGNTKQHEKTHTGEKNFNKADKNQLKVNTKQEIINDDETKSTNMKINQIVGGSHSDEIVTANKSEAPSKIVSNNELHSQISQKTINEDRNSRKKFTCNYCDKKLSTKQAAHIHERVHTGEKPYQCRYCNKKFSQSGYTKQHEKSHTGEKNFNNADKNQLKLDIKQEIINEDETENKKMKSNFKEGDLQTPQPITNAEKTLSEKKPLSCAYCNKNFTVLTSLKDHERSHSGEKPYSCQKCNKSYHSSGSMKTHRRVHNNDKLFSCKFCAKSFHYKHHLTTHERVHTGEKPFKCNYCDKKFTQSNTLQAHERIHTGERPYSCQFCDKKFMQKQVAKYHERGHETKLQQKNYSRAILTTINQNST